MYRGCRHWVYSLVCAFCILFMLFLDTCNVKAVNYSKSFSSSIYVSPNGIGAGSASVTTGSAPLVTVGSGFYHVEIPFNYIEPLSTFGVGMDHDKYYDLYLNAFNYSFRHPSYVDVNYTNLSVKDYKGDLLWSSNTQSYIHKRYLGSDILIDNKLNYPFYVCFDISLSNNSNSSYNLGCNFSLDIGFYQSDYQSNGTPVYDSTANESLDNVESSTQSTADNTSGILSSITDFFGSFFENLIGIFVPEDGYFSTWFDRVNTLLSQKLGMLYAPFDLVISILQAIYSADSTESGIPFPGIKWEDTWLVEPFIFTFASLGESFDDLRDKVYFATDTVLVLTFLMLLQSKVKLILEGHE